LILIALSDNVKRVGDPPQQYIETIIRAIDGYVTHFRLPDMSVWGGAPQPP